jgi:hypothetical protein
MCRHFGYPFTVRAIATKLSFPYLKCLVPALSNVRLFIQSTGTLSLRSKNVIMHVPVVQVILIIVTQVLPPRWTARHLKTTVLKAVGCGRSRNLAPTEPGATPRKVISDVINCSVPAKLPLSGPCARPGKPHALAAVRHLSNGTCIDWLQLCSAAADCIHIGLTKIDDIGYAQLTRVSFSIACCSLGLLVDKAGSDGQDGCL